jgi:hypothetical protein
VKRLILAIIGALLGVLGLGVLGAGAVLFTVFGTDGQSNIPIGRVVSETGRAVVVTDFQISSSTPVPLNESWFDLSIRVTGDEPHFVGVATKEQALAYLQGVPYNLVTDFDSSSGTINSTTIPGDGRPADPSLQTFWSDQRSGEDVSVAWPVSDENTSLVVMNDDGAPNVRAGVDVLLTITWAGAAAIGLVVSGLILLVLAIVVLVMAMRAGGERAPGTEPVA